MLHFKKSVSPRGFTLVEIVVVVAIIGLLISLLLVSIQSARESARRVHCSNNLRQIGLALLNYESNYRLLPALTLENGTGPLVSILPHVEQQLIYNQIDFSLPQIDDNIILGQTRVSLYRCPSTLVQHRARTDYVFNRGSTLTDERTGPWFDSRNGSLRVFPRLSMLSHGTSQTTMISEFCPRVDGVAKGSAFQTKRFTTGSMDDLINTCDFLTTGSISRFDNGYTWLGIGAANYYHVFSPNEKSCTNGSMVQYSLYTATSMHPGGVNALFADGHVEFIANRMDRQAWMQIGTR